MICEIYNWIMSFMYSTFIDSRWQYKDEVNIVPVAIVFPAFIFFMIFISWWLYPIVKILDWLGNTNFRSEKKRIELTIRFKVILLKLWMSFLLYIVIYNTIILIIYHPYFSPREWLLKPLIDIYNLECLSIVVLITVFINFYIFFDVAESVKTRSRLKESIKRTHDAKIFLYAFNILKDSRYSHVLNENDFIEREVLQHVFYKK